jgi:predicted lipoprotein with Yx(FWY)xxD motif
MRRTLLLAAAALLTILTGCGDDDDGEEAAATQAAATVALADTSLGEVLVDADGLTLYLFTKDTGGTSTCSGGCASTWPPLVVEGEPTAGDGVDEAELGTIERDDGSMQVTYHGKPLYLYAADSEPGDVAGQGVGDVWFAVTADGDAAEAEDDEEAPAVGGY